MSPSRTKSICSWRVVFMPNLCRRLPSPGGSMSRDWRPSIIEVGRGSRLLATVSPAERSVDLADAVAAQLEGGEAGVEIFGERGHIKQLVDRRLAGRIVGIIERFLPFGGVVGAAPHHRECEQFGLLIVGQILDRGAELVHHRLVDLVA